MFGFGNDRYARVKEVFERQFEPEGDNFLYRFHQKGAPIPVSSAERDRFIEEYARRLKHSTWIIYVGMTLLGGAAILWIFAGGADVPDMAIYVSMSALALIAVYYTIWAGKAPARELARRAPVGRERTSAEVRRAWLVEMSYAQLAGTLAIGVLGCLGASNRHGGFTGWGRLWPLAAAGLVALGCLQAYRKWRFEKNGTAS
jgi:hypothetical protein